MHSSTQLALMMKAKRVFEGEETFLSFPVLSPFAYPAEKLDFAGADADIQTLAEFSRVVNQIPRGALYDPATDLYLWDVYSGALRDGELAESADDPAAAEAYERASELLFVSDADGRRQDSPVFLTYKQHRDAWIAALEAYRVGQASAENSEDPQVAARWESSEQARLRDRVRDVEASWIREGQRVEVEEAEQAIRRFAERGSSSRLWREWRDAFNPDIDMLTDTGNQSFAPTAFMPADACGSEWPEFTLDSAEIARLVAEAPSELMDALDQGVGDPTLERVSFQYRSVGLTRPWLRPEVFRSRFWRLPRSRPELSDGGAPSSGACPAYVTGVVFAREIVERSRPAGGTATLLQLRSLPAFSIRPELRLRVAAEAASAAALSSTASTPRTFATAPAVRTRALPALGRLGLRRVVQPEPTPAQPHPEPVAVRRAALTRMRSSAFLAHAAFAIPAVPATPPLAPAAPVTLDAPSKQVSILALICKRLPKCPDPDPTLSWPS